MGLQSTLINAVNTAFNAAGDLVKSGTYTDIEDDGFGTKTTTDHTCRLLFAQKDQEELQTYGFREVIQPSDVIVLIPGIDLDVSVKIRSKVSFDSETYTIVDKSVYAADCLYALLLRKV